MSTILFIIGFYLLVGGTVSLTLYYDNPYISDKDGIEGLYVALMWPYYIIKYIIKQLNMNHNVFFITTIKVVNKKNKMFTWRTPGFRYSLEEAKKTVEENICDIFECYYEYAVIEELEPYLYPERKNVWWYKWDKEQEKYLPITTDATIEILNEMFGEKIVEIG